MDTFTGFSMSDISDPVFGFGVGGPEGQSPTPGEPKASRLGITRDKSYPSKAVTVDIDRLKRRAEGRRASARVRSYHKKFHPGTRWAKCGTVRHSQLIAVKRADGRCHVSGVTTCGSQAACIACGTKIRAKKCADVQQGMRTLIKQNGTAIFLTLTIPHYKTDKLEHLWPLLSKCWKKVITGKAWSKFKQQHNLMGFIRATEVTRGDNGWHPHAHVLLCFGKNIEPYSDEFIELAIFLQKRWKNAVQKTLNRTIADHVGVDIRPARDAKGMGEYLSKIGAEMCLTSHKKGRTGSRTPWQIIADSLETGEKTDLDLYSEWCRVSKNKKLLQWSAGLRRKLLGTETEKTDEQLAAEEQPAKTEAYLTAKLWDTLNKTRETAGADFITSWEQQTPEQAITNLKQHGIETTKTHTTDGVPVYEISPPQTDE